MGIEGRFEHASGQNEDTPQRKPIYRHTFHGENIDLEDVGSWPRDRSGRVENVVYVGEFSDKEWEEYIWKNKERNNGKFRTEGLPIQIDENGNLQVIEEDDSWLDDPKLKE